MPALLLLAGAVCSGKTPGIPATMALIPEGRYVRPFLTRGRPDTVTVAAFRLDRDPVSIADFAIFLRTHPEWRPSRVKRLFADSGYLDGWRETVAPAAADPSAPVTRVSWYSAKAYCDCRGKRLPSTREWERAAQALPPGTDVSEVSARVLNWYSHPTAGSAVAGLGLVNAYGVRDQLGRIWEWTSDYNIQGPQGSDGSADPKAASFFCGGAAKDAVPGLDYATFMRTAFRTSLKPEFTVGSLGFRCARDL